MGPWREFSVETSNFCIGLISSLGIDEWRRTIVILAFSELLIGKENTCEMVHVGAVQHADFPLGNWTMRLEDLAKTHNLQ